MERSQRSATALVAVVAAGLIGSGGALVLVSCSGTSRDDGGAVATMGKKAVTERGAADTSLLSNASTDLQAMFDEAGRARTLGTEPAAGRGAVVGLRPEPTVAATAPAAERAVESASGEPNVVEEPAPRPVAEPAQVEVQAGERMGALVEDLAKVIREQAGGAGSGYQVGLKLAMLAALGSDEDAARFASATADLPAAEARSLEALRQSLRAMARESASAADPEATARIVEDLSQRLAAEAGVLSVPALALCERVEGFGRYVPFARNTFTAGRSQEMIVYVEVAGFSQRAWSGSDHPATARPAEGQEAEQYVTELGQEVAVYAATDGYQALYRPEQVVKDVARRVRRDFFLVQRITLPPTLAIGTYNLKVTMRDKVTGATAEKIVPIQIVEDSRRAQAR
ncbi:MAG: hypothetical protein KF745_14635 [Phycisphaeraceae bacterium]|nr:hypothetical protein [Phycisphaeraceae bacterium]